MEKMIELQKIIKITDKKQYTVYFPSSILLKKNGREIISGEEIEGKDNITWELKDKGGEVESSIDTSISNQANLSIRYIPFNKGVLEADINGQVINLSVKLFKGDMPEKLGKSSIKELLRERNILYGIKEDVISEIAQSDVVDKVIVAQGLDAVDDLEDKIHIYFETTKKNQDEDSIRNVNYRNLYSITTVNEGEKIAQIVYGEIGRDGVDIYNKVIKKKNKRHLRIKAGVGCKILDNEVIATVIGRPSIKNGVFNVFNTYETSKDVDMESGNISFTGDVLIRGNVMEGMEVKAGNRLEVFGSVEKAQLICNGDIKIIGSVLNSKISAGSKDMDKELYLNNIEKLKGLLISIAESTKQLKGSSPLFEKKSDGELVKLLIESKFKDILRVSTIVLGVTKTLGGGYEELVDFLSTKIMGLGPLKIRFISELYEIAHLLEDIIEKSQDDRVIPADVILSYIQEGEVSSTGDIFVTGKGCYTTNLSAKGKIEITSESSVVRGGTLKATCGLNLNTVGSKGGVATTLEVGKKGIINVAVAYQNTIFKIEERKYHLETPSMDIKAYLGKNGDIIVEKLLL